MINEIQLRAMIQNKIVNSNPELTDVEVQSKVDEEVKRILADNKIDEDELLEFEINASDIETSEGKEQSDITNNSEDDINQEIIRQLEAKINSLKKELGAEKDSRGFGGFIASVFGSGTTKLKKEIEEKESILNNLKSNPTESAIKEAYLKIMGEELTSEVLLNIQESQEINSQLGDEGREAIKENLIAEINNYESSLNNIIDDQGWFSKAMGGINNLLGFGTSANEAKAEIKAIKEQINSLDPNSGDFFAQIKAITGKDFDNDSLKSLQNGEGLLSNTKAAEVIYDYEQTQATAKDIGSGIVVGLVTAVAVIAAPFTGGASIALGAAVGGATKVLIEGTDTIGTSKKYSFEQGVLDFAGGAIEGATTALTLGGSAGVAGKGLKTVFSSGGKALAKETAINNGKALIKNGGKAALKQAFGGFLKTTGRAVAISEFSTVSSYMLDTAKDNLYDLTGNYTKSESPAQTVQNEDGTCSNYYAVVDSTTGDFLYYEIETVDSNGTLINTSRSNDFNAGALGKQMLVSGVSAAAGATIGRVTNNLVNPFVTGATGSTVLGNVAEIGADAALSLGADYLMASAQAGEWVDGKEFFTWDRIVGEGRNQIRGLLIGLASSKLQASQQIALDTASKMADSGDMSGATKYLQNSGFRSKDIANFEAGKIALTGDVDGAKKILEDAGFKDKEINKFERNATKQNKINEASKTYLMGGENNEAEARKTLQNEGLKDTEIDKIFTTAKKQNALALAQQSILKSNSDNTDEATKILKDSGFSESEIKSNLSDFQRQKTITDAEKLMALGDNAGAEELLKKEGFTSLQRKVILGDSETIRKGFALALDGNTEEARKTLQSAGLNEIETEEVLGKAKSIIEEAEARTIAEEQAKLDAEAAQEKYNKQFEDALSGKSAEESARVFEEAEAVKQEIAKLFSNFESGNNCTISIEKLLENPQVVAVLEKLDTNYVKKIKNSSVINAIQIESRYDSKINEISRKIDLPTGETIKINSVNDLVEFFTKALNLEYEMQKYIDNEYNDSAKTGSKLIENLSLPSNNNDYVKLFWGENGITVTESTKKIMSLIMDKLVDSGIDWNASNKLGMTNIQALASLARNMEIKGVAANYLDNQEILEITIKNMLEYSIDEVKIMHPYKLNSNWYNPTTQNWDQLKVFDNINGGWTNIDDITKDLNKNRDYVNQLTDTINKHEISLAEGQKLYKGEQITGTLNLKDIIDDTGKKVKLGDYCLQIIKENPEPEIVQKKLSRYLSGLSVENDRFDSTTMNENLAINWAQGNRVNGGTDNGGVSVVWEIEVPGKFHGLLNECANSTSDNHYDQYEVLLQRYGTKVINGFEIKEINGQSVLILKATYNETPYDELPKMLYSTDEIDTNNLQKAFLTENIHLNEDILSKIKTGGELYKYLKSIYPDSEEFQDVINRIMRNPDNNFVTNPIFKPKLQQ